jgi:hypothetical protein
MPILVAATLSNDVGGTDEPEPTHTMDAFSCPSCGMIITKKFTKCLDCKLVFDAEHQWNRVQIAVYPSEGSDEQ